MTNEEISKKLDNLSLLLDNKNRLESILSCDEEELIERFYSKKEIPEFSEQKPELKETIVNKYESNYKESRIMLKFYSVFAIIILLAIVNSIILTKLNIDKIKIINQYENETGPGWNEWINKYWIEGSTVDNLESGWFLVEDELREIGFNVKWNDVETSVTGQIPSGSISPDWVLMSLASSLRTRNGFKTAAWIIVSLVFFIIEIVVLVNRKDEKQNCNHYKEKYDEIINYNLEVDDYNKNKYPELFKSYSSNANKYVERISEIGDENSKNRNIAIEKEKVYVKEIKEELESTNKEIKEYDGLLHVDLYKYTKQLKKIIDYGRADNLQDAINVLYNDIHQEAILNEARRKNDILEEDLEKQRTQQEQHDRRMERESARRTSMIEQHNERMLKETERANRENEQINRDRIKENESLAACFGCRHVKSCFHYGNPKPSCPGWNR